MNSPIVDEPQQLREKSDLAHQRRATSDEKVVEERIEKYSTEALDAANTSRKAQLQKLRENSSLARLRASSELQRLHGREDDMKLLMERLRNISEPSRGAILVAGQSGVGKSALVKRGLQDRAEKMGIAFVGGKFDLNKNALPYSAVADALSSLVTHALAKNNAEKLMSDIKEALGDDMQVVTHAMGLDTLLSLDTKNTQRSSIGGKEAANRLQYAVRRLMRAICSNVEAGVTLFIDDLQWADVASLELLLSLMQDEDISSLLIVGAYRDNEVSDSHPLMLQLREAERLGNTITTLQLSNLKLESVQSLLAEALRMEDDEGAVESLSNIVHKKTDGNPFFVWMFLTSLYDEHLLEYNFGIMGWIWDDKAVEQRLVTENVATFMVTRLRRFTEAMQNLMKVASCLGASFSINVLSTVVEQSTSKVNPKYSRRSSSLSFSDEEVDVSASFDDVVGNMVEQGLWESKTEQKYRFSHDQVQAAAYELIPTDERAGLKGLIGQILMENLGQDAIDEALFDVVSLLNCELPSSDEERYVLAKLNVRAGLEASDNAAFDSAVVYFEAARELLGSEGWQRDQDLTVKLYCAEARARYVIADLVILETLVDEILSRDDIPLEEKFAAYEVKILSLTTESKFREAIAVGLDVRRQLGFKNIPTNPSTVTVLREYVKTNRTTKGQSAAELAALPELTDKRVVMGQKILDLLLNPAYFVAPKVMVIVSFRSVRASMKYGINASSCNAFSTFGILLCGGFGDPKRGREMGNTAELLLERPGMKQMKSSTCYRVNALVYHFTAPLQRGIQPLLQGYQWGLESGDIESACVNLAFRGNSLYFSSRPLLDVLHELKTSVSLIKRMKQEHLIMGYIPFLQAVINLSGSERVVVLSGDAMNFEEMMGQASENQTARASIIIVQLDLFVFYQDWNAAISLLTKAGDLRPATVGVFHSVRFTFLEGLIGLKAAQLSLSWLDKRKWKRQALKSIGIVRGWLKKGNVNVVHMLNLLMAEYYVLNRNANKAEESFKAAATSAARSGFIQDKALSHELAGIYFKEKGDDYWAKYNLNSAHQSYVDWQAKSKALDLVAKYPQFMSDIEK